MKSQITIKDDHVVIEYAKEVTLDELISILGFFEEKKDEPFYNLGRLHDLRLTESNLIEYDHLVSLANRRKSSQAPAIHRNAYLVKNDLQFGMVRIWQSLMVDTKIEISIFRSLKDALDYLFSDQTA